MNESDAHNLKDGSRVKIKYMDGWATGEVTIIKEKECKVIWDADYDLDYWYYPIKDLELIDNE